MKGSERERTLDKSVYYSEHYFSMRQLCSFVHQIRLISDLRPASVLEIGIGNGFTSTFLRRSGIDVLTVDINSGLEPDVVCSLHDLPQHVVGRRFDLVVCCEVLEHMPFEEFEPAVGVFARYSDRLFLTLPSYSSFVGFSGFVRLPGINRLLNVGMKVRRPKDLTLDAHFWELGSSRATSRKRVRSALNKHYDHVTHGVFELNRYHEYFVCGR